MNITYEAISLRIQIAAREESQCRHKILSLTGTLRQCANQDMTNAAAADNVLDAANQISRLNQKLQHIVEKRAELLDLMKTLKGEQANG